MIVAALGVFSIFACLFSGLAEKDESDIALNTFRFYVAHNRPVVLRDTEQKCISHLEMLGGLGRWLVVDTRNHVGGDEAGMLEGATLFRQQGICDISRACRHGVRSGGPVVAGNDHLVRERILDATKRIAQVILCAHDFIIGERFLRQEYDFRAETNVESGRLPSVPQLVLDLGGRAFRVESQRGNEPNPISGYDSHPWTLVGFHRVQLALHRILLSPGYNCAYDSCRNDGSGKTDHPSIAFLYSINERLVGYVALVFVYVFSILGVWRGYSGRVWQCTGCFAIAVVLAFHGLSILL